MPTGDKRANIYNLRNMPQEAWDLHFFQFLDDKINDTTRAAFLQSGVLSDDTIGIAGPAADVFSLDISLVDRVIDGLGHIIDLGDYLTVTGLADVRSFFENALGVQYYVGIRYQEKPDDVERNPSSSEPEYPWYQDMIGEKGAPDNVTDNTTYIRLEIDGVLENSVDHSGRPITVWLNNPVSPTDSIAYYTGAVGYAAGVNYIDIPYTPTAGPLGQTTPTFPISTSALDYAVFIPGVSWFRNTDISTDNNYAFIGTVTGAGAGVAPTVWDITAQRPVFLISLDRAYRASSADDPAPGRTIFADKKAVRIQQAASVSGAEDWLNQALRIDQMDQSGAFISAGIGVLSGYMGAGGFTNAFSNYLIISDGIAGFLQSSEAFTALTGTTTVTFDRVGVDLTQFDGIFETGIAICELTGTVLGAYDGFYYIDEGSILSDRFDIRTPDFAPVVFPAGTSGIVRVLGSVSGSFMVDWFGPSTYADVNVHQKYFPNYTSGSVVSMIGEPIDPDKNIWESYGALTDAAQNRFYRMYAGRLLMRGGKSDYVSNPWRGGLISGHAQITVDKTDVTNLGTNWIPTESDQEWGFDYRGSSFNKEVSAETPGFQLGNTVRMPLWFHNSGSDEYTWDEPATVPSADVLHFTSGTFDCTEMPFSVAVSPNSVIMEIEFASPYEADSGIYFAYEKVLTTDIRVQKIDGSSPTFNVAATATVRFFGGAFIGAVDTSGITGVTDAFLVNLTAPNTTVGGIRYTHRADNDTATSTNKLFAMYLANVDAPMFAIRDGGITFARALTTKSPYLTGKLTQWDQIDTSLYVGDLAQIDEIDLSEGTYSLLLPAVRGNCNVIKQNGGGTWAGVIKMLNHLKFSTTESATVMGWHSPLGAATIVSQVANLEAKIPISIPQGATLNSVNIYVNPITGDGTSASLGINVYRKSFTGTAGTSLVSTGILYASSTATHTLVLTLDQFNVISTDEYIYWIEIKASDTAGDVVYSARCNYDIDNLGENWFDCF